MKIAPILALAALLPASIPQPARRDIAVSGAGQPLYFLPAAAGAAPATVLFLPGDGGWRGAAIGMAQAIASWGYNVYGLDVKRYLESFGREKLSVEKMSSDLAGVAARIASAGSRLVIVGWSQGACMAVLAASRPEAKRYIGGIVTVGLPEYGVLGWGWKDTIAAMAKREPDEPKFFVRDLLPHTNPVPLFAIHGARDDYTAPEKARELVQLAGGPKCFRLIDGANHRFDGRQYEFYHALSEGLRWVRQN